ncbi:MAG: CoA transferase [Gammaproteobacteria bacterium]|nr:CoA transferase [Gammaproteobacteria bacterium]
MTDPAVASNGPLRGLRVLDFTRVLSGPFATALLADLGAEVVKVESPQGDDYRNVGPFRAGESALFQLVNRNKLGVALNLRQPDSQELARRLAGVADVVVENFRPGVAARLGIDYAALAAANPRLVYASISGFGQTGPRRDLPAFDLVAQAMSGLMAMTGDPAGPPTRVGESMGDLAAGLFCSWAILAALYERQHTGLGRQLDVAMVDSLVALLPTAFAQWMFGTIAPTRTGNRHPLSTPFGTFRVRDGHIVICVLNREQFRNLAHCIARPELTEDPRFATDELRTLNEQALTPLIEGWLATRTAAAAVHELNAAGVPASGIEEPRAVFEGDYVAKRQLLTYVQHPVLGSIPTLEQPVRFSGHARGRQRAAPALGANGTQVLQQWLGLSENEASALLRRCNGQAGAQP